MVLLLQIALSIDLDKAAFCDGQVDSTHIFGVTLLQPAARLHVKTL